MRPAPRILVVDAAILISALLGRSSAVLSIVAPQIALLTTDRAVEETRRRLELGLKRPDLVESLGRLTTQVEIVSGDTLTSVLAKAQACLRDAVPSRNGAVTDAHVVALAWEADAEIWSHDRDFAGVGIASWSTVNLLRAMAQT